MINFCKNANCPSSQDLLKFQRSEISQKEKSTVTRHLTACEFCAAEVEFYKHYPQAEEKIEATEIPKPLYDLAKALLGNRHNDFSMLNKLLGKGERVKI